MVRQESTGTTPITVQENVGRVWGGGGGVGEGGVWQQSLEPSLHDRPS